LAFGAFIYRYKFAQIKGMRSRRRSMFAVSGTQKLDLMSRISLLMFREVV